MQKGDLIRKIAKEFLIPKRMVEIVITAYERELISAISSGEEVSLKGFGRFSIKTYPRHRAYSISKKTLVDVPEQRRPVFEFSRVLRETLLSVLNKPKAKDVENTPKA